MTGIFLLALFFVAVSAVWTDNQILKETATLLALAAGVLMLMGGI